MTATEIVMPGLIEPSGLLVRERDVPVPGKGQALVRVEATGVSFAEQQMRRGKYYDQPPFPFVPGYDFVGTVQAVGDGVDRAMIGERVAAVVKTGAWATHVLVDADRVVPVPDGIDPADAETSSSTGSPPGRCCTASRRSAAVRRSWCSARTAASAPPSCSSRSTPASP